jgi:hypothetical protein
VHKTVQFGLRVPLSRATVQVYGNLLASLEEPSWGDVGERNASQAKSSPNANLNSS